ncbi:hypothetical protein L6164_027698 [Bauhinia variegata]|uniref:Uncharacterized protein n=1 Tax=Bauhinia variegata TaxID=167791 RepID=A0ACB9LTS9_BAUVA|nr:hypothetical protein L6164_027698 [Bauhinia variegata]
MEDSPPRTRFPQPPRSTFLVKGGKSGYEPSDTESEWQEIPRHERERQSLPLGSEGTTPITLMRSPLPLHRRHSSRLEYEISSPARERSAPNQSRRRHHSKSPYKPRLPVDDEPLSPITGLKSVSPLPKPDLGRQVSPYKYSTASTNVVSKKPNYRSVTAPRLRGSLQNGPRTPSPLPDGVARKHREGSNVRGPSIGEINEIVAMSKLSNNPDATMISTESINPGDIFFSRECTATLSQKPTLPIPKTLSVENPRPQINPHRTSGSYQQARENGTVNKNFRRKPSSNGLSRSTTLFSSATESRKGSSKLSASGSVKSDASGKTTSTMLQFIRNREKSQREPWFACMRKGSWKTSNKSPERRSIDEASFIGRAIVVQSLPQFWADKHQPASLDGFICHKEEAQILKELVSQDVFPQILLKGPSGSGKRALTMALLREIYGDACWSLTHDIRHFPIQERRHVKASVPITFSSHHMELNVYLEPNAKIALVGLVKEIASESAIAPEVSNINSKADYKAIVLYDVDKAADSIQHMIKWITDRYSDSCKLILCCEDDADILETVKNRFRVVNVDAPPTSEIVEVLIQMAKEEDIDLPMSFAAKIAAKSKQNLRKAIMALEACKAHNYPFSEEQPIPLGWEEILIEIAAEILADPSHSCLFSIRGKLQKLLLDFVHPKLILQKLVEQLLRKTEASLKRELHYWHAYYDKRLPPGTTALLKLEEFVAKFMSIYRKSSSNRQYV